MIARIVPQMSESHTVTVNLMNKPVFLRGNAPPIVCRLTKE
jgi:hypothetical protein